MPDCAPPSTTGTAEDIVADLDLFKVADVTEEERNVIFDIPDDGKEHWEHGVLGDVALMTYSVLGQNIFSNIFLLPVSSLGSFVDFFANL